MSDLHRRELGSDFTHVERMSCCGLESPEHLPQRTLPPVYDWGLGFIWDLRIWDLGFCFRQLLWCGMDLSENLNTIRSRIAAACERAGRSADSVTLLAVTKTHPP